MDADVTDASSIFAVKRLSVVHESCGDHHLSDTIQAEAEKWVAEVEAPHKKEFETRAVFLGPSPRRWRFRPTRRGGILAWFSEHPGHSDVCRCAGTIRKLSSVAAKGQRFSYTFAVRPLKDLATRSLA